MTKTSVFLFLAALICFLFLLLFLVLLGGAWLFELRIERLVSVCQWTGVTFVILIILNAIFGFKEEDD